MDLTTHPAINAGHALVVLVAVAGHIAACEDTECLAKTNPAIEAVAQNPDCFEVIVFGSQIESLAGLESMIFPKVVRLSGNPNLRDTSAANGAHIVVMQSNDQVTDVSLAVQNGLLAYRHSLQTVDVSLKPEETFQGEPSAAQVDVNPTPSSLLHVTSPAAVPIAIKVGDLTAIDLRFDGQYELVIQGDIVDASSLLATTLPTAVTIRASQPPETLSRFVADLRAAGFDGAITSCSSPEECVLVP